MFKKEEQKKKLSLKDKLKNAAENISVDIFGYEKKITKNVVQYLNKMAIEERIPVAQLFVRIVDLHNTIRVFVHHKGKQLKEIPVKQLALFFAGPETVHLPGIEGKIANSIRKYIDESSKRHELNDDNLQIRISLKGTNEVNVDICHHTWILENVSVKDLVKYFKG